MIDDDVLTYGKRYKNMLFNDGIPINSIELFVCIAATVQRVCCSVLYAHELNMLVMDKLERSINTYGLIKVVTSDGRVVYEKVFCSYKETKEFIEILFYDNPQLVEICAKIYECYANKDRSMNERLFWRKLINSLCGCLWCSTVHAHINSTKLRELDHIKYSFMVTYISLETILIKTQISVIDICNKIATEVTKIICRFNSGMSSLLNTLSRLVNSKGQTITRLRDIFDLW